jgi:hypothetical protein
MYIHQIEYMANELLGGYQYIHDNQQAASPAVK